MARHRPAGVTLALIVGVLGAMALPLSGGVPSSAQGAAHRTPANVCPVSAMYPMTCCGPPIGRSRSARSAVACCPPNAFCAAPLTLSSSLQPSRAGQPITLSGRAIGLSGGVQVVLWQLLPGARRPQRLTTTTLDNASTYSFKRAPDTNRGFYVTAGSERSSTLAQSVRADVSLLAGFLVSRGRSVAVLRGSVKPGHAGEQVQLQARRRATWHTLLRARLNRRSRFRFVFSLRVPSQTTVRVKLPGDRRNVTSFSAPLVIGALP